MRDLFGICIYSSKNSFFSFKPEFTFLFLVFFSACGGQPKGENAAEKELSFPINSELDSQEETLPQTTSPLNSFPLGTNTQETLPLPLETGRSDTVTLSGQISFDLVPHNTFTHGLEYEATYASAARGIRIELLNAEDQVLKASVTNDEGKYHFEIEKSLPVRIRAYALLEKEAPYWNIGVADNTNRGALYVIQGAIESSGSTHSIRNLHASSGWNGITYTGSRSASPFAILDAVYASLDKLATARPDIDIPPLEIFWSVNNRAVPGKISEGEIGNSHFSVGDKTIYLLGSENNDADEYDRHVVSHELAHFLEFDIFRSDTIGGSHSLTDMLDMRVAFSEGYANAFAGISLDDSQFRDSVGPAQQMGYMFSVANAYTHSPGWFNESSVHKFVFEFYDNQIENYQRIIDVLASEDFIKSDALTSMHLFGSLLTRENPQLSNSIQKIASDNGIYLDSIWGAGETNNGEQGSTLPIYKTLSVNGSGVNVCSHNEYGEYNKLGNISFTKVLLPKAGRYTISAQRTEGNLSTDPDFWVYQQGLVHVIADSNKRNTETHTQTYQAGFLVIALWDDSNHDRRQGGGRACFDLSVGS